MGKINLCRIDDRLIHGQVVTKWIKSVKVNTILIIDDTLSQDPFMQRLYKSVAPAGIQLHILNVEDAYSYWQEGEFSGRDIMILFRNVDTVSRVVGKGLPIAKLNVGGMAAKSKSKVVVGTISLTEGEAELLYSMWKEKDMDIYFQLLPDTRKESLEAVLKAHFPKVLK